MIRASLQPSALASIRPYVTKNRADVPSTSPTMSSLRSCSERDSRTVMVATMKAMIPIGTFRKNTDSQPRCSTM